MALKEIEITYETLFKIIEQEESVALKLEKEYLQSAEIQIPDENGEWIDVKGLIKKEAHSLEIETEATEHMIMAEHHLIMTDDKSLKYAKDLEIGNRIYNAKTEDSEIITNIIVIGEKQIVYDMEVDSKTHLYQTKNGMVHHNTLLTSAIVKYANDLNMRTITIVPSSSLLKQTHDYIKQFDIPVGMFGGGKKDEAPNIVATWQTLQNQKHFIRDFECIIWDEVHGAKAYVAQQIMNEAKQSFMRIGLTGTVPKDPLDKANLTAGFGPVVYDVKAHELQSRNILSSVDINIFELEYPKEYEGSFVDWHDETTFLQSNEMYQSFIEALMGTLEGNTLILMKNIDPAEELSEILDCTFISSKLNVDKRQEKFDEFVHGGNHTAVGTYSLLSTGIDIVHIHNLILAPTPGKSFTKVIQSIGRGLRRKSGQKEHVTVIDLTSNLKYDKKHIKARKDYYKEAQYPFETDKIEMGQFHLNKPKKKKKS
jgi:hypothetical protein